jgi:flagellar biogenesis protein FliO
MSCRTATWSRSWPEVRLVVALFVAIGVVLAAALIVARLLQPPPPRHDPVLPTFGPIGSLFSIFSFSLP